MNRRPHALAAFFALLALVFAQVAVSAHSCVIHGQADKAEVIAHHEYCAGSMDQEEAPASGNICVEHCQYGKASFDNGQPFPAVGDLAGPFLRLQLPSPATCADARPAWRIEPLAAPPPPAILFGVLRI